MNEGDEETTRFSLNTNGKTLDIVKSDPYGFWTFKKNQNNSNVPQLLHNQTFTSRYEAEKAFNIWAHSSEPKNTSKSSTTSATLFSKES